jgi:hypothetical protein
VAKLMYLAKRVAPDMCTAVNFLATRVQNPTEQDWAKLQRALKYLNAHKDDMCINLQAKTDQEGKIQIKAYIDASHATHTDFRGQGGMAITLGVEPVFVKCRKLKLVTKSSSESELVALSDGLSQVIWLRDYLIHQGRAVDEAIIYQDNTSAIALAERGMSNAERTRHINIRYFFIKDRIDAKEVKLVYMSTIEMLADIFTKPLSEAVFRRLRQILMGR